MENKRHDWVLSDFWYLTIEPEESRDCWFKTVFTKLTTVRMYWIETMQTTSFCVVCSSGSSLEISASWSVSAAWSVVPQSLILSITAVCWVWTRFRIKLLCTLSCCRPTSGPTRWLLITHSLLLLGDSFSQCYVNTGEGKHFGTLKEMTYLSSSHLLMLLNFSLSSVLSMSRIETLQQPFHYWFTDGFIVYQT